MRVANPSAIFVTADASCEAKSEATESSPHAARIATRATAPMVGSIPSPRVMFFVIPLYSEGDGPQGKCYFGATDSGPIAVRLQHQGERHVAQPDPRRGARSTARLRRLRNRDRSRQD